MNTVSYIRVAGTSDVPASAQVKKTCIHCEEEVIFLMTEDQYKKWQINRQYIQDVFPHLDKDVREWMISGTHPQCWIQVFGSDEDEDY